MSDLENIVQEAADYADLHGHSYVTVEHITMFLVRAKKYRKYYLILKSTRII